MNHAPVQHDENQGLAALGEALVRSLALLRWLMLVLLAGYLFSGVFILQQHEKAVVLKLGRLDGVGDARVLEPGLHWTWPRPFTEIIRIPAGRVWSLTSRVFWHRYGETNADSVPPTLSPLVDGYTLTGDANIFHSQWTIRFTVNDPVSYLFGTQQPAELIERELNRAVLVVSAVSPIDTLLRGDIETFRQKVDQEVRYRLSIWPLGISIQGVDLLHVAPPLQVADAFDAVIRAEQEQAQDITDARAYAARTVNEARGDAERILAEGETAKSRLVNRMQADANYFLEIQPAVSGQPVLMRHVLWQDAIRKALSTVGQVYVVPSDNNGRREIRLQLSPRRDNPFSEGHP